MKYIELVLVENIISKYKVLATAPSSKVRAGDMVRLEDGPIGIVISVAWIGNEDDDTILLLKQYRHIGKVKEAYSRRELE